MEIDRFARRTLVLFMTIMLALVGLVPAAIAQSATPVATPVIDASPLATPELGTGEPGVDLDVLFIGAHPDDEAFGLGTYGQWNEFHNVQVGVITITRGEGGGNAVGIEEGPALGLLREDEERRAVGTANIQHIYNLDKVDFYYNVSAELTADTWGYDDTLERVIRVIRATQPEVIITMNPAPTPGQHGHHQLAARLAIDAFSSAADPSVFPEQIEDEGLDVWRVANIFRSGASGEGTPGPDCAETYAPAEPTDIIYGVWGGTESEIHGTTWAAVAREGQRMYASQGWSVFPDIPNDPSEIMCNFFTLIDSRVPFDPDNTATTAILEGAVLPVDGGLPLGSEFYLTTSTFDVTSGESFEVTAHLRLAGSVDAGPETPSVEIAAPEGWTVSDAGEAVEQDGETSWTFTVTPAEDAPVGERVLLDASVSVGDLSATTHEPVQIVSAVTGTLEPLAEVAYFREWVAETNVPALDSLIFPVFSMGSGETREITVDLTNASEASASGSVTLELPAGFEVDSTNQEFTDLAAGGTDTVTFSITNVDDTLATANEGGEDGTYPFTITTTTDDASSVQEAGINLVPVTVVPQASDEVAVDGVVNDGEYTGDPLDLSRVWEGEPVDSPADASGEAYVAWGEEGLYVAVLVTDDELGTVLPLNDAKRHWRTDSVEIAVDPLGTAANTSTTFKVGAFPTTQEGNPAAYRDADAHQGPVEETAPGFEIATTVSDPYDGYVMEVMIPYDSLPADIDRDNAALNIFIYDSDTQDLTGQTRLGWSTWGGVQGDPYRWGKMQLEGFTPAPDARTEPDEPVMPLEALQSVDSPQSILQSASDGVGLGGHPVVPEGEGLSVSGEGVSVEDGEYIIRLDANSAGAVNVFYYVDGTVAALFEDDVAAGDSVDYSVPERDIAGEGYVLVSFLDEHGHVQAIAEPLVP